MRKPQFVTRELSEACSYLFHLHEDLLCSKDPKGLSGCRALKVGAKGTICGHAYSRVLHIWASLFASQQNTKQTNKNNATTSEPLSYCPTCSSFFHLIKIAVLNFWKIARYKTKKQQINFNLCKPLYMSDTQQEVSTLKFQEGLCTKGSFMKIPVGYRRPTSTWV